MRPRSLIDATARAGLTAGRVAGGVVADAASVGVAATCMAVAMPFLLVNWWCMTREARGR